ncbi:GNAT family N-acetyltransferase [Aquabacterium sp.]|uniref:GNAT family N-acetyltransferase n=1 Tax=Aquabacterium sp. TaxID=1872578 RepID=UPI00403762B8
MALNIALESPPPRATLAAWWRALESRATATFFTSWSWIGCWLNILPPHLQPQLLVAREGEVIVGLGLVIRGRSHLLRVIPVPCWRLHATGEVEFDCLTIEYNGFLAEESRAMPIKDAMLDFLLTRTGVSRFEITKAEARFAELAAAHQQRGVLVRTAELASYIVDLNEVRQQAEGYIPLLSANTRSQVRRSLSGYRKLGEVTLTQAGSAQEAKAFLNALRALHAQKWEERGEESAFVSSKVAEQFHDLVIEEAFDRGEIQLLRILVGDTELGYLYNFVHRGRVVFYQSGFRTGLLDKQDRPGLVCHALAIEHNAQNGQHIYDFTAGDYRYKSSLATGREPQGTHVFQRDGVLPRLEEGLRSGKQWVDAMRNRSSVAATVLMGFMSCHDLVDLFVPVGLMGGA